MTDPEKKAVFVETKADFAKRVNLSRARVSQLVTAGLPVDNGKVLIKQAVEWLEQRRTASTVEAEDAEPDELMASKIRNANALADTREFELKIKRGLYCDRLEVLAMMRAKVRQVDDRLEAAPAKYAASIAAALGVNKGPCQVALQAVFADLIEDITYSAQPPSRRELLELAARHIHGDDIYMVEHDAEGAADAA